MEKNELINDFKKQTRKTIGKHMNRMAKNDDVYSHHQKGLAPLIRDSEVYMYYKDFDVVLVCFDCCGHGKKNTYAESEHLSPIAKAEGYDAHVSAVWQMVQSVRIARHYLRIIEPKLNVYGVLLTEAKIVNADEKEEYWDGKDLKVIDGFRSLKGRKYEVNDNEYMGGSVLADVLFRGINPCDDEDSDTQTTGKEKTEEEEDNEFEQILNNALEAKEKKDAEKKDAEKESTEDECTGSGSKERSETEFPSGIIEQVNGNTIKVDILRPIENPQQELQNLVGCEDIKSRINDLMALTSFNSMIHKNYPDNKLHQVSLHSIFLGRPGTGKTTVCKIFGSLLLETGALSKGHVVMCDRSTFIGSLWGDEERIVHQVVDMARGGVLMIDEAYLLATENEKDPGRIILQLLMNILADETQRDIAVVLCGYKEQMKRLLHMNPGLVSRFPNQFEFQDFSVDDLLEITRRRILDFGYQFTTEAWQKYSNVLAMAYQVRDPETWGNARFVANQLERIYVQHARRCMLERPKAKSALLELTPEDIVPIEVVRQKPRIGF